MTDEQKKQIDEMDYELMLRLNRFAPPGHPMFIGDTGKYFMEVMRKKRDADPDAAVRASKSIGWDR